MSGRSAQHDAFTIERRFPASPARVFASFADQGRKARWFGRVEGWVVGEHTLDFRVGGREVWRGGPSDGAEHRNDTVYHDIVPNERIVWSYTMAMNEKRISVSLSTVELLLPPLVLLHGGGSTIGTNWSRVIPLLKATRQVIAVEFQAHGHTRDIDRPFTFEQSAEDVAALLTQLHVAKADVFGFSNGGTTALKLAIHHPALSTS